MGILTCNVQEHEQAGEAKFWMGEPISQCRSLAMRRGWEMAREQFEAESKAERELWYAEAAKGKVRA